MGVLRKKTSAFRKPRPLRGTTHHADVAKFVGSGHGVVIQEGGGGDPPRVGVVGEDDELVLVPFVAHPDEALLDVRHDHSVPDGLDPADVVGDVLRGEKGQRLSASSREV